MGFFHRNKVSKTAAGPVPVKPAPVNASGHYHASPPPPPPRPPRYATSTTQTPTYWQPQAQYHHPPPPYHHPQQELQHQQQVQQQQQQQHRPQGWSQHPQRGPYPQPIVVNQHYHLHPPPPSSHLALTAPPAAAAAAASHAGVGANPCPLGLDKFAGSVVTIAKDFASPHFLEEPNFHPHAAQLISSTAVCMDQIAGCFNDVMTLIDCERLVGNEKALFSYQQDGDARKTTKKKGSSSSSSSSSSLSKGQSTAVAPSVVSGNYFAKVELYANSRLAMNLPPLRLYMPTWPILCMAAQYAERVYDNPKGAERDAHVSADWRTGTKAMVIKSVPMDHVGTIVFAIRGSASVQDWAVNLKAEPVPPAGFLDDPGNSCHAGFLDVARKTVRPVAARLRQLLEEDPRRSAYSLLITGHSAGGAVASLLYAHMLSTSPEAESELNVLTGCFKRVHCVTFGTPPVSLLPLQRPDRPELRKSLFLTFVNEGDPVPRADKAYVKSLLELFAAPPPPRERESKPAISALVVGGGQERETKEKKKKKKADVGSRLAAKASKMSLAQAAKGSRDSSERDGGSGSRRRSKPMWNLPPSTLSSPGRIVVLRSGDPRAGIKDRKTVAERLDEGVIAQTVTDQELRQVVWGDPVCHLMRLYSGRIETLAVGAVTGKHG
ncbi:Alpha/Beta hydrolase protein [Colletotrichum navitas]|uniref:Alpha/Beta hydrolase protein n=1 Tax=Colletotrichum navitas TaxID=681940 RepID=A0AAD8PRD0_9PEZI|nr:Alpha/Beta hydrolase protein [Colletotrichum navitas]KAK1579288.1 Alpha/Beta hydrolase protein [Colletotrichum navitas]